ncbi:MAG: hypothetical protein Q8R55_02880 [Candidatus Taylorbacteria bacterium]|nr:hypothetical protein [Candidatus Taylorbacteria bacterium]
MVKLPDVSVDDIRDILSQLKSARDIAKSSRELLESLCSEYSNMERWIRESFVFMTHQEADHMDKLLKITRKYITSFDVPDDKDFPGNLVLLVEAKIEALEKAKNQPAHEPDPTAEYCA